LINAGQEAERQAAVFLQQRGLKLLASNYRCRFGEIDLVMQDGKEVVFVEVRLRSHAAFGGAAESITHGKQQKLARAASHYLAAHGAAPCRFDAMLLNAPASQEFEWIKNAFDCSWG
jgi:putative endonuclease